MDFHLPWVNHLAPGTGSLLAEQDQLHLPKDGIDDASIARATLGLTESLTSVSGLNWWQRRKAINLTLQAAVLGMHHRSQIHYTQGSRRWWGIDYHLRASKGQIPRYADCSSFLAWCYWNGLSPFHLHDIINGQRWRAGYTGTMLQHGQSVSHPIPGDAIIYRDHTALYTGGGLVVSNGSEGGPYLLPMHYRRDIIRIKRYI